MTMITAQMVHDWLVEQPPETEYNFYDTDNCLMARFATEALGLRNVNAGGWYVHHGENERMDFAPQVSAIASAHPHTYGAALERAKLVMTGKAPRTWV